MRFGRCSREGDGRLAHELVENHVSHVRAIPLSYRRVRAPPAVSRSFMRANAQKNDPSMKYNGLAGKRSRF